MAQALKDEGVAAQANIVAWNWQTAAGFLPPQEKTPKQGLALYQKLGSGYAANVHFLGHSLGPLVNASAANHLHGDASGRQERASPAWSASRTHMTLVDEAELAALPRLGREVLFDIGGGFLQANGAKISLAPAETTAGWKNPVPVQSAWVDSYVSLARHLSRGRLECEFAKGHSADSKLRGSAQLPAALVFSQRRAPGSRPGGLSADV